MQIISRTLALCVPAFLVAACTIISSDDTPSGPVDVPTGNPNGADVGGACGSGGDCKSGVCTSAACASGKGCKGGTDCESKSCDANVCKDPTPTDGVKNGTETDVDCGGGGMDVPACAPGKACAAAGDCESKICGSDKKCTTPTKTDG